MPVFRDRPASSLGRIVLCCSVLAVSAQAFAGPLALTYDSFRESKTLTLALDAGHPIHIDAALRDAVSPAIDNTLVFRAGSTSLALSAAWLIAPTSNRTVGFNIDLLDAQNTVVATDTVVGNDGTQVSSRLTANGLVVGGLYHLAISGNAAQIGRYQIDMVDGAVAPPALPAIPVSTAPSIRFDTHLGTKDNGSPVATGDALRIEGDLLDDDLASFTNRFSLALSGDTLSAGIEWIVAAGDQRTTGFNVDLVDALNTIVASDTFLGLVQGEAFSQFSASGIGPGLYTLVITGNAPQRGRYRVDLSTSATAPGFDPILVAAVPEPSALLLLSVGALALLMARRRAR